MTDKLVTWCLTVGLNKKHADPNKRPRGRNCEFVLFLLNLWAALGERSLAVFLSQS